ncbi:hypothetical protein AB6N28_11540 [Moraxella osloensis]
MKLEGDSPLWTYKEREKLLAADKENPLSGEALNKKLYDEAFDIKKLKEETTYVSACFAAGTLVHTDKGLIPIQDIRVGDMVLSRPEWGGRDAPTQYKRVARAFCSGEDTLVQISYITEADPSRIKSIYLTDNHPVWIQSDNEWTPAIDLRMGSKLSFKSQDINAYLIGAVEVFEVATKTGDIVGLVHNKDFNDEWDQGIVISSSEGLKTFYISDLNGESLEGAYSGEYIYVDDFPKISHINQNPFKNLLSHTYYKFKAPVYNLEVEDFHTYFVGEDGLWVHNTNCGMEQLPYIQSQIPSDVAIRNPKRSDPLPDYVHYGVYANASFIYI